MKKLFYYLIALTAALVLAACAAPAAEEEPAAEEAPAEEEESGEEMEEEEMEEEMEEEAEAPAPEGNVDELVILWAQWDPADFLQQVGNLYEEETGIAVTVLQEPWGSFGDLFFTEMAAGGTSYDMVVGDSQWLGQSATQGHIENMTEFLTTTEVDGVTIADSVTPATLTFYGEYPTGSGEYYGYPTEGDALGWAYRTDLFEDPTEMENFEAEYGYPLAPPTTYDELRDIAEFFTRPDEGLYGSAIYTQADYDALTMGFEAVFFSYGAEWQDPETFEVEGIVNSPESIAAAEFYRELYDCCQPPGMSNSFFAEANDAFISGQAAMIMNYFAFFPALANSDINPYSDTTGYFVNPAGPDGDQFSALGGQGVSIISYIDDERKAAAYDFIEWFAQEEIQFAWAEFGGYSCNAAVLGSEAFAEIAPYNAAFAETMFIVKDYWNVPVFGDLLFVTQTELGEYIVGGEGTAEEAMNDMAERHTEILQDAGLIE